MWPPHRTVGFPIQVPHCVNSVPMRKETGLRKENIYFSHQADTQVNSVVPSVEPRPCPPPPLQVQPGAFKKAPRWACLTQDHPIQRQASTSLASLLPTMKLAVILALATLALCCSPGESPGPLSPKPGSGILPAAQCCPGQGTALQLECSLPARKLGL